LLAARQQSAIGIQQSIRESAGSAGGTLRSDMKNIQILASVCLMALVSAPAIAQSTNASAASATPAAAAAPAPEASAPTKIYTVTTGLDFASAYVFRGILQESGGAIGQPYADVAVAMKHGITADFGTWNSIHSTADVGNWYESDYFASVTFTTGKLKPGLLYTSYTSPADRFSTVQELAGTLVVDDSKSPFPLSPKVILAFELGDGEADAGENKGTYLELGIKPAVKLAPKATLYIPVKTGLSVNHYYEGPTGNNTFGYFDLGGQLSVPLAAGKGGALEAHGGLDLMWLGDNMKALNSGDSFKPVFLIGMTFTY
jgi:hypothetical protein